MKLLIKMLMLALGISLVANLAYADLKLNHVQFDPAVVAAGDDVDIIVQFEDSNPVFESKKIGNDEYTFKVSLAGDDDLTRDYVTIVDSRGDDLHGSVYSSVQYNKVFRVKVSQDAPVGNYQFELSGQWYKNDEPVEGVRTLKFEMPVKKEGIILELSSINTIPSQIRAGDNFVEIKSSISNVGEKDAKSIEVTLELPEGMESSYSNNNRVWVPRLNAGESYEISNFVNLDKDIDDKVYDLEYSFSYLDLDNNDYSKEREVPLQVKPRPYLEVSKFEGEGLAGGSSKLYVWVKNIGELSAESVDVRVLKQSSQPFVIDVRSDYIGELEAGEEGLAIFDVEIDSQAELKSHDFKLIIRSTGDSDEGDDTVYTYNRRASFDVTGEAPNKLLYAGILGLIILIGYIAFRKIGGGKKK